MNLRLTMVIVALASTALAGCTDSATGRHSCDNIFLDDLEPGNPDNPVVAMATSKGCIVAELYAEDAPITVENFLAYVDEGFYSDLLVHRIIQDFMIQTGGMDKTGQFKQSTHDPIHNEAAESGLKNVPYTLSMARTSAPDSATNQFFINTAQNTFLDPNEQSAGYAVFGSVIKGRDVVDGIEGVATTTLQQATPSAAAHCQNDGSKSCPTQDVDLFSIVRVV